MKEVSELGFIESVETALELDKGSLQAETKLSTDFWDSLAIITVIAIVDEEFGLILEGDEVMKCESISDILELVEGKKIKKMA